MTKQIILFFVFSLGLLRMASQTNLIPNPSFEIIKNCPDSLAESDSIKYWFKQIQSPDFYSSCYSGPGNDASAPTNSVGYQCPANGSNYIGLVTYINIPMADAREIICTKLTNTLVVGTKYYFTMKLSLGKKGTGQYSNNKMGIRLFTDSVPYTAQPTSTLLINNNANAYSNQNVNDTLNWTTIKLNFTADSNYKYLSIGNFYSNANCNPVKEDLAASTFSSMAYYFIDDVCLSTDSNTCFIPNQSQCVISYINELRLTNHILVSPNPSKDFISITGIEETVFYKIFDQLGRIIKTGSLRQNEKISIKEFTPSLYYIEIKEKELTKSIKFIVNE